MRCLGSGLAACTSFSARLSRGGTVARHGAVPSDRSPRAPSFRMEKASFERAGQGIPDLDRLIHERIRLGIISALAANPSLTFNDLKRLLKTTDGNLSVHAEA